MGKINTRNTLDPRTLEFSWKLPVLSSITTPPSSPKNGARHRIIGTATGVFAGKENQIAIYDADNATWFFETYGEGSVIYDFNAHDFRYVKTDLNWEQFDKIPLAISDVTGLQAILDTIPELPITIEDVTGLQTAIDEKEDLLPSKSGNALKVLRVNAGEDGFEFVVVTGITAFDDSTFEIHDEGDNTKKLQFDAGTNIPNATTVVIKVPNANGQTMATLESDQVFNGLVQALTMIATDSLTTDKIVLSDSATDPTVNGQIQNNGGIVKIKSNNTVFEMGISAEGTLIRKETVDISEFATPTLTSVSSNSIIHTDETISQDGAIYTDLGIIIDGDLTTETNQHLFTNGQTHWVKIDRGSVKDGKFSSKVRNAGTFAIREKIETSDDDIIWTTRVPQTNIQGVSTLTMPDTVSFRYIRVTLWAFLVGETHNVSVFEIWDTLATSNNLIDGDLNTHWESVNEVGANFVISYATLKLLGALAIVPHSNMTATQFKIELSPDNITYTRVATVDVADLTDAVYNFIRWNILDFDVRYIKITSLDAGAVILAVSEVKHDNKTSLELLAGSGRATVSSTDPTQTKISVA